MTPTGAHLPLGAFIRRHHDEIIGEFSAFARTLAPPGADMTETDLRDHAKDMLIAIAHGTDESVTLSVHNDGPPIPPAAQAAVFEPLARGESDATQSIGLGLFIARAIVIGHGGEIRLRSSDELGTTFEVRLPRIAATAPLRDTAVEEERSAS